MREAIRLMSVGVADCGSFQIFAARLTMSNSGFCFSVIGTSGGERSPMDMGTVWQHSMTQRRRFSRILHHCSKRALAASRSGFGLFAINRSVSQTLTLETLKRDVSARHIVIARLNPIVLAKIEFGQIPIKVLLIHVLIGSDQSPEEIVVYPCYPIGSGSYVKAGLAPERF